MKIERTLQVSTIEIDNTEGGTVVALLDNERTQTMSDPGVTELRLPISLVEGLELARHPFSAVRLTLEMGDS